MKIKKVCATCGSDEVFISASAFWNTETQAWEVSEVYDGGEVWCNSETCEGAETEIMEEEI
jgi:hypothetical protein